MPSKYPTPSFPLKSQWINNPNSAGIVFALSSSVDSKREIGFKLEAQARAHLLSKGFKLIEKNFLCRVGEIDLIFEEKLPCGSVELVFVEVRGRHHRFSWLSGTESVDLKKQICLKKTIRYYLANYRGLAESLRIDIMAWDGRAWAHTKNVWI